MKVLVIGSGKVGAASAWALVKDSELEKEKRIKLNSRFPQQVNRGCDRHLVKMLLTSINAK